MLEMRGGKERERGRRIYIMYSMNFKSYNKFYPKK